LIVSTGILMIKLHVAIYALSVVLHTIVQYPGFTYFTRPFSSTVATDGSEDVHVTFLFTPSPSGSTVATNWNCPTAIDDSTVVSLSLIPDTGSLTYTSQVATLSPSSVITVIVVEPPETPVIVAV
jgi:hypothetical protein